MDGVRHRREPVAQELGRDHLACLPMQFGAGEPGCAVDPDEQAQFALGCLACGDVDMDPKDRAMQRIGRPGRS